MRDGALTPGPLRRPWARSLPARGRKTARDHHSQITKHRDNPGLEARVEAGADLEYDPLTLGGNTKLVVRVPHDRTA
jgi:hypothetical protein